MKGRIQFYESSCKQPKKLELGVSCREPILVDKAGNEFVDTGVLDLKLCLTLLVLHLRTPMALFLDLCAQPGNIRCLEVLSVCPSSESLCANVVVNNSPGLASSKLPFKTVIELPSPPALTQFNSANVSSSAPPCEFLKSLCASHSNQVEDSICSSCASAQCHLTYFSRQCQVNHLLSCHYLRFSSAISHLILELQLYRWLPSPRPSLSLTSPSSCLLAGVLFRWCRLILSTFYTPSAIRNIFLSLAILFFT